MSHSPRHYGLAGVAALGVLALLLTSLVPSHASSGRGEHRTPRTVITTDMEQDDLASLIRYLLYTNEIETQGLIYTSSKFHWAGDGQGTEFFLPNREYDTPQTSWRWVGTHWIDDVVLPAWDEVHPNLRRHDRRYPSADELADVVRVGNIDFEGDMAADTPGSDLIKQLLLDRDRRPLYLQAWGGMNTIARALKSIEDEYAGTRAWPRLHRRLSQKAVILASGFQDETYASYISKNWPSIRVEELSRGYSVWGYNCDFTGQGNIRGLPEDGELFQGAWTKKYIQIGPFGSLYRSWLDGQAMEGDPLDIFGIPELAPGGWCPPLQPYDFLSEGDNVAYLPLLRTGIESPEQPWLGGWGGRLTQVSSSPNLWEIVPAETDENGASIANYSVSRWQRAVQNDFAARMSWTMTPRYAPANHAPRVRATGPSVVKVRPGEIIRLRAVARDPDRDRVAVRWWQYLEEGTYPGRVTLTARRGDTVKVAVPADAKRGQTISLIVEGTDDGEIPLTRYDRVVLEVRGR